MVSPVFPATQDECRPASARWHVLYTKSRQEKALAEELDESGVTHFLPLVRTVRYYGRRKAVVRLPLFPGYMFLHGTREEAWAAGASGRVVRLIRVADQEQLSAELASLRTAIERDAPLIPRNTIYRGLLVEVVAGPFRGVRGLVCEEHPQDRLILQVQMLGRAADLEIDRSLLRPV